MSDKVNDIKMIKTNQVDYMIPSFLTEKFAFIPQNDDFFKSYASTKKDIVPLWWQRDVDLVLSGREAKKAKKRSLYRRYLLRTQKIVAQRVQDKFKKIIDKQIKAFKKECRLLHEQIDNKKQELELLEQKNRIEYQNKLLELELEIQQCKAENILSKVENIKSTSIKKLEEATAQNQQHYQEVIAALDKKIQKYRTIKADDDTQER